MCSRFQTQRFVLCRRTPRDKESAEAQMEPAIRVVNDDSAPKGRLMTVIVQRARRAKQRKAARSRPTGSRVGSETLLRLPHLCWKVRRVSFGYWDRTASCSLAGLRSV